MPDEIFTSLLRAKGKRSRRREMWSDRDRDRLFFWWREQGHPFPGDFRENRWFRVVKRLAGWHLSRERQEMREERQRERREERRRLDALIDELRKTRGDD